MARLLLVLGFVAVAFWVYSIVDCALQSPLRARGVRKPVWLVIVIVLPVIGGLLWFVIGRTRASTYAAARRAPDDDPEFLGSLGSVADQDERIRRLEEELALLDAEADDPPRTPPPSAGDTPKRQAPGETPERQGPGEAPNRQPRSADDDDPRGPRGAVG